MIWQVGEFSHLTNEEDCSLLQHLHSMALARLFAVLLFAESTRTTVAKQRVPLACSTNSCGQSVVPNVASCLDRKPLTQKAS